jgi:signal transduction histidine kinase
MALVLAATGLFVYLRLQAQLDKTIDQELQTRARALTREIRVGDVGLGEAARSALRERGDFGQVLTADGRLFDPGAQPSGPPVLGAAEVRTADARTSVFEQNGVPRLDHEPVRLLAMPISFEGHPLIVIVGSTLNDRNEALSNLETLLLIGGPVALILASLAAYATVAAALRPVEAMRRRAAGISAADSSQRLPLPAADDELRRLGETLNEMLARLHAAVERERAFVDDASHELRTPLALHKTELEVALRYAESPEELRAAIASAIEESDRLWRLAEDLLFMARADKGGLALNRQPVEVSTLFAGVEERMGPRVRAAGRALEVDGADALAVEADRDRIEQALGNLVENALRHGWGTIRLSARPGERGTELHVTDSGPGFPADFLPHAFERFRRADAARSEGGTGLGLAIVGEIAHAHGGRAEAENSPGGGADVWIELATPDGDGRSAPARDPGEQRSGLT